MRSECVEAVTKAAGGENLTQAEIKDIESRIMRNEKCLLKLIGKHIWQ